jgi:hypothetical protein
MRKKLKEEIESLISKFFLEDTFYGSYRGMMLHEIVFSEENKTLITMQHYQETKKRIVQSSSIHCLSAQDKELWLLNEAASKGYLDRKNCFIPVISWSNAQFTHQFSDLHNYHYFSDRDELVIPAIGVGDNFYAGNVTIYKQGKWAKIEKQ